MKKILKTTIIILVFHINSCYNYNYIIFNLQRYINDSNNNNMTNFIYSNLNSLYYTELNFGIPEQNYILQINLDDYKFQIINYNCEIETTDKSREKIFDPFLSKSSIVEISGINFTYRAPNQIYRITDSIRVFSNNTSNNIYPNITFIYNPRNLSIAKKEKDYTPYTCFKLGLRLPDSEYYNLYEDYEISLLGQFKRRNITNSYEWFIEYGTNNNNDKLIIGTSPHIYNNKKYIENNSKKINGIYRNNNNNNYFYWNFAFTQIYIINKDNKREFLDRRDACFVPSLNVIKGTYEYQKKINDTLFSELINNHKCYEESLLENNFFYCDNKKEIKEFIKDNFVNLIFFNANLEERFIFTYDDLFFEKDDKIYFLVFFDSKSLTTWIIGKPFLKKYFFSYNYDMKTMTYYKNNIYEEDLNNLQNNNWILIIIIICLIIIFSILGFLLAKYLYDVKNKKKATELDESFPSKINEPINIAEGI